MFYVQTFKYIKIIVQKSLFVLFYKFFGKIYYYLSRSHSAENIIGTNQSLFFHRFLSSYSIVHSGLVGPGQRKGWIRPRFQVRLRRLLSVRITMSTVLRQYLNFLSRRFIFINLEVLSKILSPMFPRVSSRA